MNATDEWKWIRECRTGSTAAFEPLVRAHEKHAHAFARGMLGDNDTAADAVQDAFVRAYRSLDRLKNGSGFGPWYRTILRNICLDRLRSPAVSRSERLDSVAERERGWSEPMGTARIEHDQLAAAVRNALDDVSPAHRSVLVLKEIEGMSYAEIGRSLGIASGTVASRLHHARIALRESFEARRISLEDIVR